MSRPEYGIEDLLYLMKRLRDPEGGCPWDIQQTFETIVPHTLEESYELADAIENGDLNQVREELGDVLFQVIFYSQLGSEAGAFEFEEVVSSLVAKLVRRHPHVFPDGTLQGRRHGESIATSEIKDNWEAIKQTERQGKQQHGVLDDVPVSLPALSRAAKLQKRAAGVGFDWDNVAPIYEKILEEMDEVKATESQQQAEEELGDLLFACVNLTRHLKVNPETALRRANQKFERRFRYIEQELSAEGKSLEQSDLATLDALWEEAKQRGL